MYKCVNTYTNSSCVSITVVFKLKARKFLPYGFGPGDRTVIEDAASFDDDEEDYGEYQVINSVSAWCDVRLQYTVSIFASVHTNYTFI